MYDLISVKDLSREFIEELFLLADKYNKKKHAGGFEDKVVAGAFFEPSTRTTLSFETAAKLLGAEYIGFRSWEGTSLAKGETLADTIRMLDNYADCIVIRHPNDGAARFAAEIAQKPVVNAGDGKNEHPTQSVQDLYTIRSSFGKIDGLTYGFIGDLHYARAVNSLLLALNMYKPKKVYFISPESLTVRGEVLRDLKYKYEATTEPHKIIDEIDVLYITRIQKERFTDPYEYKKVEASYKVDLALTEKMKDSAIIMHPLPRVNETDRNIDGTKRAKYFIQASFGVPVRMAILSRILGGRK